MSAAPAAPDGSAEATPEASNVAQVYGTKQKRMTTNLNFLDNAGTKTAQRRSSLGSGDLSEASDTPRSPGLSEPSDPPVEGMAADMMLPPAAASAAPAAAAAPKKFGTFMGVFVPCCQNILGVILFLRLGTIVGQAGVHTTLVVVGLCCLCTFMTSVRARVRVRVRNRARVRVRVRNRARVRVRVRARVRASVRARVRVRARARARAKD